MKLQKNNVREGGGGGGPVGVCEPGIEVIVQMQKKSRGRGEDPVRWGGGGLMGIRWVDVNHELKL